MIFYVSPEKVLFAVAFVALSLAAEESKDAVEEQAVAVTDSEDNNGKDLQTAEGTLGAYGAYGGLGYGGHGAYGAGLGAYGGHGLYGAGLGYGHHGAVGYGGTFIHRFLCVPRPFSA